MVVILRFTGDRRKQVNSRFMADKREAAPCSGLAF
jgi:hypothetical protein